MIAAGPLKSPTGSNRILALSASRVAAPSETAPKAVQVPPPSREKAQLPKSLSRPVTAMPDRGAASTSVTAPASSAATRVPGLSAAAVSSMMASRCTAPELSNTGASLTGARVMWTVAMLVCAPLPTV